MIKHIMLLSTLELIQQMLVIMDLRTDQMMQVVLIYSSLLHLTSIAIDGETFINYSTTEETL